MISFHTNGKWREKLEAGLSKQQTRHAWPATSIDLMQVTPADETAEVAISPASRCAAAMRESCRASARAGATIRRAVSMSKSTLFRNGRGHRSTGGRIVHAGGAGQTVWMPSGLVSNGLADRTRGRARRDFWAVISPRRMPICGCRPALPTGRIITFERDVGGERTRPVVSSSETDVRALAGARPRGHRARRLSGRLRKPRSRGIHRIVRGRRAAEVRVGDGRRASPAGEVRAARRCGRCDGAALVRPARAGSARAARGRDRAGFRRRSPHR